MASEFSFPRGQSLPKTSSSAKSKSQAKQVEADPVVEIEPEDEASAGSPSNNATGNGPPEYAEEELLRVFDEILFSNEYSESFDIRGRMEVTFRTRTAKEVQDIDKGLDSMGASLMSTVENVRSFKHLEKALVSYNGKDVSMMKQAEKENFVQALPGPIIGALLITLARFDHKVGMACRVGEQNF